MSSGLPSVVAPSNFTVIKLLSQFLSPKLDSEFF